MMFCSYEMVDSPVKGVAITTTTNDAYGMMKHGPGDPEYEVVGHPVNYEVPAPPIEDTTYEELA